MSAITHPDVAGKADLLLASMHSTTRANFSKHKVTFERQSNLPPTFAQKSIEARGKYRDARNSQLS
jgi:hypothetical protein